MGLGLSYPPPQGAIAEGMTEYQLKMLPWKADKALGLGDLLAMNGKDSTKDDDAIIYCYHSDNPQLIELRVTVKNHKVIAVAGGNG